MEHTELTPGQRVRFANSGVGTDQIGVYVGTDDQGLCLVTWDGKIAPVRVIRANLFQVTTGCEECTYTGWVTYTMRGNPKFPCVYCNNATEESETTCDACLHGPPNVHNHPVPA